MAERLKASGVTHAFGVTGSGPSWTLITALDALGIPYLMASHEASAAIMAGGVTSAGRGTGVSVTIKGPGLANAIPGITFNHFEGIPSIHLAEAYGDAAPRTKQHKRLDHGALTGPVAKVSLSLSHLHEWDAALRIARSEVPGPVHVDLAPIESLRPVVAAPTTPTESTERVLKLLEAMVPGSRRPVLILGSLATRRAALGALGFEPGIPTFTTAVAKGIVDERRPLAAGVFTGDGRDAVAERTLLPHADLVVAIGVRHHEVLTPKAFGVPTLRLDEVPASFSDGFGGEFLQTDDWGTVAGAMPSLMAGRGWGDDLLSASRATVADLVTGQWSPGQCYAVLNADPRPLGIVVDTGSFCTVAEHLIAAHPGRPYLGSGVSRFMGVSLPQAIGWSLGSGRPVACIVGDGGLRQYASELRLIVDHQLPVCVVLMRDGRYGSVAGWNPSDTRLAAAVTVSSPSWSRVVEAMGGEAHVAACADDFERAFSGWSMSHPCFIEARFDPEFYARMTERLR